MGCSFTGVDIYYLYGWKLIRKDNLQDPIKINCSPELLLLLLPRQLLALLLDLGGLLGVVLLLQPLLPLLDDLVTSKKPQVVTILMTIRSFQQIRKHSVSILTLVVW